MSGTYKATGINLKGMAFGESDRLLTVLTQEHGLIRAIAPGSRKHDSSLRGRSGLFVVNNLLIAKGRSLDKITQAESLESFPGLSQSLSKLTASQYLAELVLYQALSDQPQTELFDLLRQSLRHLEQLPSAFTLPCLVHAVFHLLGLAGVAPEVQSCCVTKQPIAPDRSDPGWRIGFSVAAGGTVQMAELDRLKAEAAPVRAEAPAAAERSGSYRAAPNPAPAELYAVLTGAELALLQQLETPDLIQPDGSLLPAIAALQPSLPDWLTLERVLRHYAQYHFERPIRSAALIDTCFLSLPQSAVNHDATA